MKQTSDLKEKVRNLPLQPGVYFMKDSLGQVIYVGKAKALKNRVSSYFQNPAGMSPKTRKLVSHIVDFDIIVTQSEFEALVLENAMIKKYKPKYNILLKDDKGYPYIRLSISAPYPDFSVVAKPLHDGERYFGPYTGRRVARQAIDTIQQTLGLKNCKRQFPRDIGKERPCLYAQMGRCIAPCTGNVSSAQYRERIDEASRLLEGKSKALEQSLAVQMEEAADTLQFERAATLRDRLRAVQALRNHQQVVASGFADTDVFAFVAGQNRACVVVLHYLDGMLQDKEYTVLDGMAEEDASEVLGGFIKQYYTLRGITPRLVLLSHPIEEEEAVGEFLASIASRKVELSVPQRGHRLAMLRLAQKNAEEELLRRRSAWEKKVQSLTFLQQLTGLPTLPKRLEAYDISHFSGEGRVGSMVVFENARPKKSAYRKFQITAQTLGQDDYAAMCEMIARRLQRYLDGDPAFAPLPDAFLLDGGKGHVNLVSQVVEGFGLSVPCFGMVKDGHHRTRGLVSPAGEELSITTKPALFALIGTIQEEVHRFAITYNRKKMKDKLRASALDGIAGVGQKRKEALFRHFQSIQKIQTASLDELEAVVPHAVAQAIVHHFAKEAE